LKGCELAVGYLFVCNAGETVCLGAEFDEPFWAIEVPDPATGRRANVGARTRGLDILK
jgi:hypothetical protein